MKTFPSIKEMKITDENLRLAFLYKACFRGTIYPPPSPPSLGLVNNPTPIKCIDAIDENGGKGHVYIKIYATNQRKCGVIYITSVGEGMVEVSTIKIQHYICC